MAPTASSYDLFLSYNSADHTLVEEIAQKIRDQHLEPFFDRWYLAPGARWRSKLEDTLSSCKAVAIFVGPGEMGRWQQREVDVALDLQANRQSFPVIPVLLPGCEPPLGFLRQLTWVDLRNHALDQAIVILAEAARGKPPGPALQSALDSIRASVCPYRGLLHFREEDAPFFFGRQGAIDKLVDAVQRHPFVAVVGASGSGKSSVARSGLVPRLRSNRHTVWETVILVPTDQPLNALARALIPLLEPLMSEVDRLAEATKLATGFRSGEISLSDTVERILEKQPGTDRVLLVVDQFEELYTLTADEGVRRRFLDEIIATSSRIGSKVNVVLTLRGDFVGSALAYRPLSDRLQDAQINLGPMTREEPECVIRKPAEKIQLEFERGLVRRILNDVGEEPGNLPLLEFVLKELWDNRHGGILLNETYDAKGGLQGAVAAKADELFRSLSSAEQKILQRIFLRIVRPSEGGLDTRRRADFTELPPEGKELVSKLTDERLLVTNQSGSGQEQTVEVAHEALISNWGTLRAWVNEDREFLLWRDRLSPLVEQWERNQESEDVLLRGPLLVEAQKWFDQRSQDLSDQERKFISASREQRERLAGEERARQQRELAEAEERRLEQATAAKSLRRLAWVLAAVALAAIGGAGFGLLQKVIADREKQDALTAKAEADKRKQDALNAQADAEAQKRQAVAARDEVEANNRKPSSLLEEAARSDRLVAQEKLQGGTDADALAYLARASRYAPKSSLPPEAAIASVFSLPIAHLHVTFQGHTAEVNSAVFSSDGRRVLTASGDRTARLWETESGKLISIFQGHSDQVNSAVFSPDGLRVLTASRDQTARLWEADSGKQLAAFGHNGWIISAIFSPDGLRVLTASDDKTARLWEADSGKLLAIFQGHSDQVNSAVFSPDGLRVLTASRDQTARLWEADGGKLLTTFQGHGGWVISAIFSPDGLRVLTASDDKTARLWEADSGKLLATFHGHTDELNDAVFSPDGRWILTASKDKTARLWESKSGELLATFQGHTDAVDTAVFSPDGRLVLTASRDNTVRLWESQSGKVLATFQGGVRTVSKGSFSPDGRWILTASTDNTAQLWDADSGKLLTAFEGHANAVTSAVFSPNGQRVLTGSKDKTAKLWEADSGKLLAIFEGHTNAVSYATLSPDGRQVLTASMDQTARLWETESGKLLTTFRGHTGPVYSAAFSPDGRRVLTASEDETARLWDADSGKRLTTFEGHTDDVYTAVFSPDGARVLTASRDRTARLWQTDTGKLTLAN